MKKMGIIVLMLPLLMMICFSGCACEYHTLEEEVVKNPTCTVNGLKKVYCTECDYSVEEAITSSHDFQKNEIITEATCTEDGAAVYKCTKCGDTEERTLYAGHSFVDNKCTVCNMQKSDKKADTWYTLTSNNVFHCQNAEISNAVPMSKGSVYMVTYYPFCRGCKVCGEMGMTGVSVNSPVTETYYCDSCSETTYVKFKLEY